MILEFHKHQQFSIEVNNISQTYEGLIFQICMMIKIQIYEDITKYILALVFMHFILMW